VAFERGLALGQMAAGLAEMAGGAGGSVFGGLLSATGIGATLGVPAIAVSAVVVTGGAANVMAGLAGLMSSGSGGSPPKQVSCSGEGSGPKAPSKIDRSSFKAEREAFWKAEARNRPENYSADDLDRMRNGRAPTGPTGIPWNYTMRIAHLREG